MPLEPDFAAPRVMVAVLPMPWRERGQVFADLMGDPTRVIWVNTFAD